jgi:hypothetical protein
LLELGYSGLISGFIGLELLWVGVFEGVGGSWRWRKGRRQVMTTERVTVLVQLGEFVVVQVIL